MSTLKQSLAYPIQTCGEGVYALGARAPLGFWKKGCENPMKIFPRHGNYTTMHPQILVPLNGPAIVPRSGSLTLKSIVLHTVQSRVSNQKKI